MRRYGVITLGAALLLSACSSLESVAPSESPIAGVTTASIVDDAETTTTQESGEAVETTTTEASDTTAAGDPDDTTETTVPDIPVYAGTLEATIVETYPHDAGAYTEGLEFHNGSLIEAIGLYGSSTRRQLDVASGAVATEVELQPEHWGSGLSISGATGVQVTRNEKVAILFDPETLKEFSRFDFETSAWGVCATEEVFYVSTGSNTISLRDPMSFLETSTLAVTQDGAATGQLGELECVGSHIWAVIWPTNTLVQIDASGVVTATADLTALVPEGLSAEDSLAGVAYNPESGTFFVTGKRWGSTYEITFTEAG